jgi:chemotaxis protein CheD
MANGPPLRTADHAWRGYRAMTIDPHELERTARHVNPGAWAVEREKPIATLLGSCVAVCLWDPTLRLGGLNHFMLPNYSRSTNNDLDLLLCGDYCMEALLNGMLALGAQKKRLQGKAFGGGSVLATLSGVNVGQRNVAFALQWLERENILLTASDLEGTWSRKVVFDPQSGYAFCKRGHTSQSIAEAEQAYANSLIATRKKSDIELF